MDFTVAKQPIVTMTGDLYGYELLYRRDSQCDISQVESALNPTDNVISGYLLLNTHTEDAIPVQNFINFTTKDLMDDKLSLLDPLTTVIEVLETCEPNDLLIEKIKSARRHGFTIAFDDITLAGGWTEHLSLAHIAKIDVLNTPKDEIAKLCQLAKGSNVRLLAEKVEDEAHLNSMRAFPFELFQGYFFCKPLTISLDVLAPSAIHLLKTFGYLYNPKFDPEEFIRLIYEDPTLVSMIISRANRHYRLNSIFNCSFSNHQRIRAKN
jgi:c-di-GMP-related signal transduction protein